MFFNKEHKVHKLKKRINSISGAERLKLIDKYKNLRKELLKTPYTSQTGKKIVYQRYADDFLVGINGNRKDCLQIKSYLSEFISTVLKMKLSEEKTLITHSSQPARFLGTVRK
jgi:hypothetical protein